MNNYEKYLKYKNKYLKLKNTKFIGGTNKGTVVKDVDSDVVPNYLNPQGPKQLKNLLDPDKDNSIPPSDGGLINVDHKMQEEPKVGFGFVDPKSDELPSQKDNTILSSESFDLQNPTQKPTQTQTQTQTPFIVNTISSKNSELEKKYKLLEAQDKILNKIKNALIKLKNEGKANYSSNLNDLLGKLKFYINF
jgi:hypothetical protein